MITTVSIDNTSDKDNYIVNRSNVSVSVSCVEMFGSFSFDLRPGESKRVTSNVRANVYPLGTYSYDDPKYGLGRSEKWEIKSESGILILSEVNTPPPTIQSDANSSQIVQVVPARTKFLIFAAIILLLVVIVILLSR